LGDVLLDSKALTKIQSIILIAIIAVAVVGVGTAFLLLNGEEQSSETIKIGILADLDMSSGKSAFQGAILAAEQLNAEGGILGRDVEVIGEDSDVQSGPHGTDPAAEVSSQRYGQSQHKDGPHERAYPGAGGNHSRKPDQRVHPQKEINRNGDLEWVSCREKEEEKEQKKQNLTNPSNSLQRIPLKQPHPLLPPLHFMESGTKGERLFFTPGLRSLC